MKEKLLIIGGGISGLVLADKYKDKYNINLVNKINLDNPNPNYLIIII